MQTLSAKICKKGVCMARANPLRHHRCFATVVIAAVCALAITSIARADFQSLSQKLPASSNAVVAVNVAKLLKTPMAQSEEWAQNSAAAWANEPVMIPKGST